MQILKHKGNTLAAFKRSIAAGFGVELDIRDLGNDLVVSHDVPGKQHAALASFLKAYAALGSRLPLALNIKSCGLQNKLSALLQKYKVRNYFVFDMAVPDGVEYFKHGLKVFTRQSEYEFVPAYYNKADGVWLDEFNKHWIGLSGIQQHLKNRKKICIVSPELHKRDFRKEWADLKRIEKRIGPDRIMLCTDHPQQAALYFNGQD